MKKLLCLLLIGGAFVAFTSCSKNCTCTEQTSKISVEIPKEELNGVTCKELEDATNAVYIEAGLSERVKCK